jgi:hypothetical protein
MILVGHLAEISAFVAQLPNGIAMFREFQT